SANEETASSGTDVHDPKPRLGGAGRGTLQLLPWNVHLGVGTRSQRTGLADAVLHRAMGRRLHSRDRLTWAQLPSSQENRRLAAGTRQANRQLTNVCHLSHGPSRPARDSSRAFAEVDS